MNGNGHLIAVVASMPSGEAQVACIELKSMGWEALAKAGVDLSRFLLVPHAPGHCAQVCAFLLDAFDVVCLGSRILASSERRQIVTLVRAKRRTLFIYEHWVGISRPWNLAINCRSGSISSLCVKRTPMLRSPLL